MVEFVCVLLPSLICVNYTYLRNLRTNSVLYVNQGRMFQGELDWCTSSLYIVIRLVFVHRVMTDTNTATKVEAPEYRKDLHWVAKTATRDIERVREGIRGKGKDKSTIGGVAKMGGLATVVEVRCVILTRGGEQA